jgi:hypothetical protein
LIIFPDATQIADNLQNLKQPPKNNKEIPKMSTTESSKPSDTSSFEEQIPICVFRDNSFDKTNWPIWWLPVPGEFCLQGTDINKRGVLCTGCGEKIPRKLEEGKKDPNKGQDWYKRESETFHQTFKLVHELSRYGKEVKRESFYVARSQG